MQLTEKEQELVKIFEEADKILKDEIKYAETKGNKTQFLKSLDASINSDLEVLRNKATNWIAEQLPPIYRMALTAVNSFYTKELKKFTTGAESGVKQQQLDLILKTNPATDDIHTWIRRVGDIKTYDEVLKEIGYEKGSITPDFTETAVKNALKNGKITVYSSKPISSGHFVTPSKMEAQSYAGSGKVYSQEVDIQDIAWIDEIQGQYAPVNKNDIEYPSEFSVIHREALNVLINKTTLKVNTAIEGAGRRMNDMIREAGQEAIKTKLATGSTLKKTQKLLVDKLEAQGLKAIKRKDGSYMSLEAYAETVARSTTREATNLASITQTLEVGDDLVKMSSHSPTCPICLPLQGRVYSISGESKDYPPLTVAWTGPYANIHPRCRHVFNPYILDFKTDEEIKADKEFSNRSFNYREWDTEQRKRAEKSLALYNDQQRVIQQRWYNRQQYNKYKATLGADSVPKTFSAFVNMKKSNNTNWQQLQSAYRKKGEIIKHSSQPYIVVHMSTGDIRGFIDENSAELFRQQLQAQGVSCAVVQGDKYHSNAIPKGLVPKASAILKNPESYATYKAQLKAESIDKELKKTFLIVTEDGQVIGFDDVDEWHMNYKQLVDNGITVHLYDQDAYNKAIYNGLIVKPKETLNIEKTVADKVLKDAAMAKNQREADLAGQTVDSVASGSQIIDSMNKDIIAPLPNAPTPELIKAREDLEEANKKLALSGDLKAAAQKDYDEKNELYITQKDILKEDKRTLVDMEIRLRALDEIPNTYDIEPPHYETLEEAKEAFRKFYPGVDPNQVFVNMDLQRAQNFMDALEEMNYVFDDFPDIKGVNDINWYYKNYEGRKAPNYSGVFHNNNQTISVKKYSPTQYENYAYWKKEGFFSSAAVNNVEAHELGHALHYKIVGGIPANDIRAASGPSEKTQDNIIKLYRELKALPEDEAVALLSKYGLTNNREMVAESISEILGGFPRPYAVKVYHALMDTEYKRATLTQEIADLKESMENFRKTIAETRAQLVDIEEVLLNAEKAFDTNKAEQAVLKSKYDDMLYLVKQGLSMLDVDQITKFDYGAYPNSDFNNSAFKKWFDEATIEALQLTKEQRSAVSSYTGSLHWDMNEYLRSGETKQISKPLKEAIEDLKVVVETGKPFYENTTLYRGVDPNPIITNQLFGSDKAFEDIVNDRSISSMEKTMRLNALAVGNTFFDTGFSSSSYNGAVRSSDRLQFIYYVDKGVSVGRLLQPISNFRSENEVLIKPNVQAQVLKVEYTKQVTYIHVYVPR